MLMAYFGHLFQTLGEILFNYLVTLQGRSLPEWSTLQFLTLRAPANIRPDRKGCTGTNALDYFGATTLRMTTLSLTAESQHNTNDHFPLSTGTQLNLRFCPAIHGILFQSSPPHPCHGMDVNGKGSFLAPKLKLHLYVHRLLTLNLLLLTPLFPSPQVSLCCLPSYRVSGRRSFCRHVGDGEEKKKRFYDVRSMTGSLGRLSPSFSGNY